MFYNAEKIKVVASKLQMHKWQIVSQQVVNFAPNTSTVIVSVFVSFRGTYLERQTNKVGHAATGSVALPAVMRAGGPGTCLNFWPNF